MQAILYILLFVLFSSLGFAKSNDDKSMKQSYILGEKLLNDNNYKSALSYFLELDAISSNANISYHIGLCYLNAETTSDQEKALEYLTRASEEISASYSSHYKETKAPVISLYYLSISYTKNYDFEKASQVIHRYISMLPSENIPEITRANQQLHQITNAQKNFTFASASTYNVKKINKKPLSNKDVSTYKPQSLIFIDDSIPNLVFSTQSNEICKINYKTSTAEVLDYNDITNLSPFITCVSDQQNQNIFMLKNDGKMLCSEKLTGRINPKSQIQGACLSKDGKTLYFSSNRKGGFGGYDIYKCEMTMKGTWGKPQNLGLTVNTGSDEITPFILTDGATLFFSSNGDKSIGGFDVLTSTISEDGFWSESENIGFPLNTVHDEKFFMISKDEEVAFFLSSKLHTGFDIFMSNLNDKQDLVSR